MKTHKLKTVVINHIAFNYFYVPIKNDKNGHPRFMVYIMDPDAAAVYEKIFTSFYIEDTIKKFIMEAAENEI